MGARPPACPVCSTPLNDGPWHADPGRRIESFPCPTCGDFRATREAVHVIQSTLKREPEQAPLLGYAIRRLPRPEGRVPPTIFEADVRRFLEVTRLPRLPEQVDNFIL